MHLYLFQPIRVRVLSELYHNCLLLKNEIAATVGRTGVSETDYWQAYYGLSLTRQAQKSSQST